MKADNIKIKPQWKKSKEEIWDNYFEDLEKETPHIIEMKPKTKNIWYHTAVAVAVLAIMMVSFSFLYTKSETAVRGEHLAVTLPDGSKVFLNSESKISYKPIWWKISRDINLNGEAFFDVEKGSTFNVYSGRYVVSVLGTSFNIYSREDYFTTTCITGKVNVSADKSESILLTPNMQAIWADKKLTAKTIDNPKGYGSWRQGKLFFDSLPLKEVIQEIERQYNVQITTDSIPDVNYYGYLPKTGTPKEILTIIGKAYGIEFVIK